MKFCYLWYFSPFILILLLPSQAYLQTIPEFKLGKDDSYLKLGGALRFNYNFSNWIKESRKQGGEFGYDVLKLSVDTRYERILLNAEYRFYASGSGGGMLKQGWIGYQLNQRQHLEVGQNRVPFGMMPYQSNNWFFNINYYLGMEDDADMGVKYVYVDSSWEFAAAFYKNSDILNFHSSSGISTSRYGYDIAGRNMEINQGNLRMVKHFDGEATRHEVGGSAQIGGIYNLDTKAAGFRSAFALHYVIDYKRWEFKTQYTFYHMHPKNAETIRDNKGDLVPNPENGSGKVAIAAYGAVNYMASKGETYIADLAYRIPVKNSFINEVKIYSDFGWLHKKIEGFADSYQMIPGAMLTMGPIYTYVDYAMGKNHPWLGPEFTEALAGGGDSKWTARFNINVGYYF